MNMSPRLRTFTLTVHIICSVGLLGAIGCFLALAIAGLMGQDARMVRAAYVAMEVTSRFVIVPLAFASLLTGTVQSLGTSWGLLQHYWVIAKLLITLFATVVLLLQMQLIDEMARIATETTVLGADLTKARMSLVVHAAGGLLLLLLPAGLSVYKPRGRTWYGQRKAHEHGMASEL